MSDKKANKMWGGRFESAPSDVMVEINTSIDIDKRLYSQDIAGSIAHCQMLVECGILNQDEGVKIQNGLNTILDEIENGAFIFKPELEDIHMNIESRLSDLIGDVAGKLHTARSRNDQVVTDFRLWLKSAIDEVMSQIDLFQSALEKTIAEHDETIMPGFTHLQIAQPVTLSMHLGAYKNMLERDKGRFLDAKTRMDECPLGACALAGTSYPTNRDMTAKLLGFDRPMPNKMDCVASRDFALEFLSSAAICSIHLSRFAEELILWSTSQFGYIRLSDSYTSGSSIMPQKKNADAAELVRGKSGRVTGNLVQLLMVMKALPLTYNKDMQEDKEAVFDTFDTLVLCLKAMTGMVSTMTVNKGAMLEDAENGYSTATDLADWLVKNAGLPFREAHHITGNIVKLAEKKNKKLHELSLTEMKVIDPRITDKIFDVLSVQKSVSARKIS